MMIIKGDDFSFLIPFDSQKTILISNGYKNQLIDCLYTYFVLKKKTKCVVYDDDDQIIQMNEMGFIYLSEDVSYENNMSFKTKTVMNTEISEIIRTNPEYFLSLDNIRNELIELKTDKGIVQLRRILGIGLEKSVDITFQELNISSLIQMFEIDGTDYSESEKRMMLLNLMLFVNRNKTNIVLLDKDLDCGLEKWMDNYGMNTFFIIDNDAVNYVTGYYDMVLLSDRNHLISYEETMERIRILSYMNHNLIKANMSLQNEKNVEIFNQYSDYESTFFIKNISSY